MNISRLLIANRGEIAMRIHQAAAELGIIAVAVFSEDDAQSPHVSKADESIGLKGTGVAAYLDIEQILAGARETACDAIHPGYGFLAENAALARGCEDTGIEFVGPSIGTLELLGNKLRARMLAEEQGVPTLRGSNGPVTVEEARHFFRDLESGAVMVIKAVAGGGGRGIRVVEDLEDVAEAYARCQSEAKAAFGDEAVYVEEFLPRVRHIEVQVVGDGHGVVSHLGERECSIQRRHQKLIEIAPSPSIENSLRDEICAGAVRMAEVLAYRSLGTFEFLVDTGEGGRFAFIEGNARLQVEHTVTEAVTGVDLVQTQLRLAGGETLPGLGLTQACIPGPRGFAIQARINTEKMAPDGTLRPSGGYLTTFMPPSGPGIRVDTYGVPGYTTNPNFDSLLAKVIAHSATGDFPAVARRMDRALEAFDIGGIETNLSLLRNVLRHDDFVIQAISTQWLDDNATDLVDEEGAGGDSRGTVAVAGAAIDRLDPLASLDFFRKGEPTRRIGASMTSRIVGPPNTRAVPAPLQATVTEIRVAVGDVVREGQLLFVMSALKMEHVVKAAFGGIIRQVTVSPGEAVYVDHPLAFIEAMDVGDAIEQETQEIDLDYIRPSLQAVLDRRKFGLDENRPEAVERRRSKHRRTVRENIEQLIDPGTWVEYGQLTIAGQRNRRSLEELVRKTPADGLVAGIGSVNGDIFDEKRARTMFISYDDTVFAGTQGVRGHDKTDRMADLANELSLPLIFHAEGAGGRSGDTEGAPNIHPSVRTFEKLAQLSGKVPMIGITAGWCYAGNASVLGLTDIIIATEDSLIAMGGPSTIEGGGLGVFLPEEVGPISDTAPAGTVDIVVKNHDEAIAASKKCLSYFQGSIDAWECADQRYLRHVIPENRLRSFDIRELIHLLADKDSVLELRPDFGISMVTAFVRIEGHPFGLTANNNDYIGGAIDSPGSDKVARFWQICDAFNIPIITLVDTPGMMVGPEVEKSGLVRHCSRLFVTGANLETARFAIILRKGYALGSIAVMTGSSRAPVFTVAWPAAEFGGMNLESAVLLGAREELAKIEDVEERASAYQKMVDAAYERADALTSAAVFGIDDIIDPAETRQWIADGLTSVPDSEPFRRGRRTFLDTW